MYLYISMALLECENANNLYCDSQQVKGILSVN